MKSIEFCKYNDLQFTVYRLYLFFSKSYQNAKVLRVLGTTFNWLTSHHIYLISEVWYMKSEWWFKDRCQKLTVKLHFAVLSHRMNESVNMAGTLCVLIPQCNIIFSMHT